MQFFNLCKAYFSINFSFSFFNVFQFIHKFKIQLSFDCDSFAGFSNLEIQTFVDQQLIFRLIWIFVIQRILSIFGKWCILLDNANFLCSLKSFVRFYYSNFYKYFMRRIKAHSPWSSSSYYFLFFINSGKSRYDPARFNLIL